MDCVEQKSVWASGELLQSGCGIRTQLWAMAAKRLDGGRVRIHDSVGIGPLWAFPPIPACSKRALKSLAGGQQITGRPAALASGHSHELADNGKIILDIVN